MQNEEAACLGAAMLAGVAVGIYSDLGKAVSSMVALKDKLVPDAANSVAYDEAYRQYTGLYESLLGLFAKGR
jgi:xylulokinase